MNDQLTEAQNSGYNPYADRMGAKVAPCEVLRADSRAQHSGHIDQASGCWCPGHGTVIEASANETTTQQPRVGQPAHAAEGERDAIDDTITELCRVVRVASWRRADQLTDIWPELAEALAAFLTATGDETCAPTAWRILGR